MRIYVTFDIDWAPDFVLEDLLELLGDRPVCFMVTHPTRMIASVAHAGHELGWHPNFLRGSTQGAGYNDVLDYLGRLVENPAAVRSHNYLSDATVLDLLVQRGVQLDLSLLEYLNPAPRPYTHWNGLTRCPTFWEDDVHLLRRDPMNRDFYRPLGAAAYVYNFHPMHVFLNSDSPERYQTLVRTLGKPLWQASRAETQQYVNEGTGVRTILSDLLEGATYGDLEMRPPSEVATMGDEAWPPGTPGLRLTTDVTSRNGN